MLVLSNVT